MTEAEKTRLARQAYGRILRGDPTSGRWRMRINGVVTTGPVYAAVDTETVLRDLIDTVCTK